MQTAPVYPFAADRSGTGGGLALAAIFLRQEGLFPLALGIRTECSGNLLRKRNMQREETRSSGMESRAFSLYNEHEAS